MGDWGKEGGDCGISAGILRWKIFGYIFKNALWQDFQLDDMEDKSSSTVTDCTSKVYFDCGKKKLSIERSSVFLYEQKASAAG